jgi:hypothetical protein
MKEAHPSLLLIPVAVGSVAVVCTILIHAFVAHLIEMAHWAVLFLIRREFSDFAAGLLSLQTRCFLPIGITTRPKDPGNRTKIFAISSTGDLLSANRHHLRDVDSGLRACHARPAYGGIADTLVQYRRPCSHGLFPNAHCAEVIGAR